MKVLYEKSFLKDLEKIQNRDLKKRVRSTIDRVKTMADKSGLKKTEKLKGHESAYKIRVGNYRIGLFMEGDTVIFSRVLHRKDIYRKFP